MCRTTELMPYSPPRSHPPTYIKPFGQSQIRPGPGPQGCLLSKFIALLLLLLLLLDDISPLPSCEHIYFSLTWPKWGKNVLRKHFLFLVLPSFLPKVELIFRHFSLSSFVLCEQMHGGQRDRREGKGKRRGRSRRWAGAL